ncbi:sensor domain-containing protein [Haloarcula litorea]|uniref:sensor domain-containing protein n=1 Tax=Haloarcula litorea TaxID=3032579 RepID=UPI0023E83C49|nr:sensor domain-containing protein [Halomicroarcula sp. GDY20]
MGHSVAPGDALTRFVTAPLRVSTYKRLAYLLLAFPLGLAYFVGFATAASTGGALAFTLVGVPLLLLTLLGTTAVSWFEAGQSRLLLDREVAGPATFERLTDEPALPDDWGAALKRFLSEPTTWTSVGVVLWKFVFGVLSFAVVVTAGSLVTALLAAPFVYDEPGVTYRLGIGAVDTLPEAVGLAVLGLVALLAALNLCNLLATLGSRPTELLLSAGRDPDPE